MILEKEQVYSVMVILSKKNVMTVMTEINFLGSQDLRFRTWKWFGYGPLPVTVTTRIITFLIGNSYKPSFATITGRGDNPRNDQFQVSIWISDEKEMAGPPKIGV